MVVKELYDITTNIKSLLEQNSTNVERMKLIEKTTRLLNKREEVIAKLPTTYTPEEKKLFGEIVQLNKDIDILLNHIKDEIQLDLQEINKKKLANQKYNQIPHGDGMFFDKRK